MKLSLMVIWLVRQTAWLLLCRRASLSLSSVGKFVGVQRRVQVVSMFVPGVAWPTQPYLSLLTTPSIRLLQLLHHNTLEIN